MRFSFRTIILFSALIAYSCAGNDNGKKETLTEAGGNAIITFSSLEHDFGKIAEGEKVGTIFTFSNSGDGNLVIASATTSCGCTVPEYSNKPVRPGETGTLEVVFDSSHREGKQTKTITVRSNADKPVVILKITADIVTNNN